MSKVPHLVQYQGSKRNLAPEILKYIPKSTKRIIEPFAGTGAVSILAAQQDICSCFLLNDINEPLVNLLKTCVNTPNILTEQYSKIWNGQFENGQNNVDYFYKIREEFNNGMQDPARMLFLLSRVVKGAIRYNAQGAMNQSCDKRRYGTKPSIIEINANRISKLLFDKTEFYSMDYKKIIDLVKPGDLVYLDPPYQGTSNNINTHDKRYIQGIDFDEFVKILDLLNSKAVNYIVSYDGMTGNRKIGKDLPDYLDLIHLYITSGISAQSTLNGKREITYESLYLSKNLYNTQEVYKFA